MSNKNRHNIEVGDLVQCSKITYVGNDGMSVSHTDKVGLDWERFNANIDKGYWKITKMNKGKITGYKLKKDTPNGKAGDTFIPHINYEGYVNTKPKYGEISWFKTEVFKDTEWFEPIYEVVKPTEVYVDTLAGKVKVTSEKVSLGNQEFLYTEDISSIVAILRKASSSKFLHSIKVETFKVGCKTFHVNDIPKLEEAIKQVS